MIAAIHWEVFASPQLRMFLIAGTLLTVVLGLYAWQEHRELRRQMAWRDARLAAKQTAPAPVERRHTDWPGRQLLERTARHRDRLAARCVHLEDQATSTAGELAATRKALKRALEQAARSRTLADERLAAALAAFDRVRQLEVELDRTRAAWQAACDQLEHVAAPTVDGVTPSNWPEGDW
jgi:hypothetical protein